MNFDEYKKYISAQTMMGPNSVRILDELFEKYPLQLGAEAQILDLGCGKGLTSLVIAKETGAKVYANDLWISAEDNEKRFTKWGVDQQVIPVCEDANELHFKEKQFNAIVSVDSYHYFAAGAGFFEDRILPFLDDKAAVLIGIPGVKNKYGGRSVELLSDWLGDDAYMFKSPEEWKEIVGNHDRMERVETWEMNCFEKAWDDWFACGHEFARVDRQYFETVIKPYTCFVGICIKIK